MVQVIHNYQFHYYHHYHYYNHYYYKGDHPTTRLCCKWLARNIETNKNIEVLDYGCGSAILGLSALKYGATKADGTDIDLDALISASRNCINNNLSMDLYLADDSELDEVQR